MAVDVPVAYYNENDPFAAAWLEKLIDADLIAPGWVDTRSIEDVHPEDLDGFTQCHFFAGIGGWSYALRLAGWPDDREVWTGSCPCPSFSCAGKGSGFEDPRHLWPEFYRLIRECRPPVVFGEQVNAAIGHGWWDLVSTDLESAAYAVAAAVLASASVGATDIRHRLYFVGMANSEVWERERQQVPVREERRAHSQSHGSGRPVRLADSDGGESRLGDLQRSGQHGLFAQDYSLSFVADERSDRDPFAAIRGATADALKGHWRDADWLFCTDGRWRPVEAGTFPLDSRIPNRLGRLRGYGNAINAQVAQAFIEAYMSIRS